MKVKVGFILIFMLLAFVNLFGQVAPFDFKAVQNNNNPEIKVTWVDKNSDEDGFFIYLEEGTKLDSTKIAVSKSEHIITGLKDKTTYNVYMKAFRIDKTIASTDTLYSSATNKVNVTIKSYELMAPTALKVIGSSIGTSEMEVTWEDNSILEDGYEIFYKAEGASTFLSKTLKADAISTTITALIPDTEYEIYVLAYKNDETKVLGPPSASINVTTLTELPPIAFNLSATENCPEKLTFTWKLDANKKSALDSYTIERSPNVDDFVVIKENLSPNVLTFTDNSPGEPGSLLYYRIISYNSKGDSLISTVLRLNLTEYEKPPAVTGLYSDQAERTPNQLRIRWDNPEEDAYNCKSGEIAAVYVFVRINGSEEVLADYLFPTINNYLISGLMPGDVVNVRVSNQSIDDHGALFSDSQSIQDITYPKPSGPSGLVGESFVDAINNTSVKLTWQDGSNDEDGFIIWSGDSPENLSQLAKIKYDITEFVHTPVEEGRSHFYAIQSFNWVGTSDLTAPIEVNVINYKAPNAPVGLVAKLDENQATLTWRDDSFGENDFILERSEDQGKNYSVVATLPRNTTEFIEAGLVNGNSYWYRVKSRNNIISSEYSNVVTFVMGQTNNRISESSLVVYPNPTLNFLNIKMDLSSVEEKGMISIFNNNNQSVLNDTINLGAETKMFDLRNLKPGIYTVLFQLGNQKVSKRIIKN